MNIRATTWDEVASPIWGAVGWTLRPLQLAVACPSVLYLVVMTVLLFRPPGFPCCYADRIAFVALVFFVVLRVLVLRQKFPFVASLSYPMMCLTGLAVVRVLREPFDAQNWSIVASKFIVPFVLFHVAILVFRGATEHRHFETFVILALAYLVFVAIAFLANAHVLVFPRFILDESIGFHADRARGPFLQAVANGMSLNLLGILALVSSAKHKVTVGILWLLLPVAVLATMTRAVWIAFAFSTVTVGCYLLGRRQAACVAVVVAGLLVGLSLGLDGTSLRKALWDRTAESGPVAARIAVYEAGWTMFRERPLTGWSTGAMYGELARRMQGYHLRAFYVHNTYLALLIEFGLPGLALYAILFFNLLRLARPTVPAESALLCSLRKVWPVLLGVYLLNAFFVDMAYPFVIGLLFTVAGLLCASNGSSA
jgi:putative inorganic carbon (HCO3(-)) transporter